jgi:hypothetical protein
VLLTIKSSTLPGHFEVVEGKVINYELDRNDMLQTELFGVDFLLKNLKS